MTRRELILLLGGGALLHTPTGRAQEPGRIYRLGVILREPRDNVSFVALLEGCASRGLSKGRIYGSRAAFRRATPTAPRWQTRLQQRESTRS
jgi:hypothetical protein